MIKCSHLEKFESLNQLLVWTMFDWKKFFHHKESAILSLQASLKNKQLNVNLSICRLAGKESLAANKS